MIFIVNVTLADGRKISASPGHPTADGRLFGDLRSGDILDGSYITQVDVLLSNQPDTFDLLPSSSTGYYWANGVLIGSTLKNP